MPQCGCRSISARAPPMPSCAHFVFSNGDEAKGDFVWRDHVSTPSALGCNTSASI
jgi:hypothetical protein